MLHVYLAICCINLPTWLIVSWQQFITSCMRDRVSTQFTWDFILAISIFNGTLVKIRIKKKKRNRWNCRYCAQNRKENLPDLLLGTFLVIELIIDNTILFKLNWSRTFHEISNIYNNIQNWIYLKFRFVITNGYSFV